MNNQPTEQEEIWGKRFITSNKAYQNWESKYSVNLLEEYYRGAHWKNNRASDLKPYTFNIINATIQIKLASYLFTNPKFLATCTPGKSDYNQEQAFASAQLKEDILNTVINDPKTHFKNEVKAAFKDSFFRFGIIEVGYGADWITNPNAGKPLLKSDTKRNIDIKDDKIIREPNSLPENERIYFKHIQARRFRVGGKGETELDRCNWVGYYDFVYKSDLVATLKDKSILDVITTSTTENITNYTMESPSNEESILYGADVVKVWHIWDLRARKRLLILDSPSKILWSKDFSRLPLFDFRWDEDLTGWYPIPPVFQWLSPQDEINEVREAARQHRRKFTRKYAVKEGTIDEDEKEKLVNGPDGTIIMVKGVVNAAEAIMPIQDAAMNTATDRTFAVSKDDFNIISGTSSEVRGVADRTTATQAQIIDKKSSVREDYESAQVSSWLCEAGREALLLMKEKFVNATYINLTVDPGPKESFLGEVQETQKTWQLVSAEKLDDGYDVNISLDIVSMSPQKAEDEKKKFLEFNAILAQYPQISLSPYLVREAAYRCGYRNEKAIKEFQQMALIHMLGVQAQMGQAGNTAGGGGPQNQAAQGQVAQMTPNTNEQIRQQITGQIQ